MIGRAGPAVAGAFPRRSVARLDVARVGLLVAGLAAVVTLRWAAQVQLPGSGLAVGLGFGASLLVVAVLAATAIPTNGRSVVRSSAGTAATIAAGVATGLVLVALAATIRADLLPPLRPAAPFVPWVAVTVLVATAEEALLRGTLFAALERIGGPLMALAITSLLFAVIHVPFYGAAALPLDLAVGIVFGGLRIATGGIAAPVAAHATADLATWWL